MLTLRHSTRNLKCNLLLNSNFNHFIRFYSSIYNIPRIAIYELLLSSNKYRRTVNLHCLQQSAFCSSFTFNDHSQNGDLADNQQETELILAQLGSKLPITPADKIRTLRIDKLEYVLGRKNCFLLIAMKKDENANKWIELSPIGDSNCLKIAVSKDAYLVVNAMDTLLSKSVDDEKPPICNELVSGCIHYDYKLEFRLSQFKDGLYFYMVTIPSETQPISKRIFTPIESLPSLRNRIAEMLAEFDGTQEIETRHFPLPKWLPENVDEITGQNANKSYAATILRESLDYTVDDEPRHRTVRIVLEQDESENKSIKIVQKFYKNKDWFFLSSLIVSVDAHHLLNGMQSLFKVFRKKRTFPIYGNQSLICRHIVRGGLHNDYKLEIHLQPNKQLDFKVQTITTGTNISHKPRHLKGPIPIYVFNWMKDKMATILAEYGELTAIPQYKTDVSNSNCKRNYITLHTERLVFVNVKKNKKDALLISVVERDDIGSKFIHLKKQLLSFEGFSNISIPQDAYLVVKAMDALLTKSVDDEKPPLYHVFVMDGLCCDFELGICSYKDQYKFYLETIASEAKPDHNHRRLFFPIGLLPLLRDRMAKILTEFDDTEEIESRPSSFPKWISKDFIQQTALLNSNNTEVLIFRHETLKYMVDVEPLSRKINITLSQGVSGNKFIRIAQMFHKNQQESNRIYSSFRNIPVPEDAYSLLNAMCALQNELEKKYQCAIPMEKNHSSVICRQKADGLFYDYLLEINLRPDQQLEFTMKTIATDDATSKLKIKYLERPIPIHVLHWLKDQMAEMLLQYELDEMKKKKIEEDKSHLSPDTSTH